MPEGRIRQTRRRRALPRAAWILTTAALVAGSATGVYGAIHLKEVHAERLHRLALQTTAAQTTQSAQPGLQVTTGVR